MLEHWQTLEREKNTKEQEPELEKLSLNVCLCEGELKQKEARESLEQYRLDLIKE